MFTKSKAAPAATLPAELERTRIAVVEAETKLAELQRSLPLLEDARLEALGVPSALILERNDLERQEALVGSIGWEKTPENLRKSMELHRIREALLNVRRRIAERRSPMVARNEPTDAAVRALLDGTPAPIHAAPKVEQIDRQIAAMKAAIEEQTRRVHAAKGTHGHALVTAARNGYAQVVVQKAAKLFADLGRLHQVDRAFRDQLVADGADPNHLAALDPLPLGEACNFAVENSLLNRLAAACEAHGITVERT